MIDNILYTPANIAGLGTSSSRSGSSSTSRSGTSSTSRSGTSSATDGKTLYTLPDGNQYSMTKGEYEEFHAVFDKAASIAGASKMPLPKTTDVLKYGYAVLDSYERGMVFNESEFLAMMGAKQQQHQQQTNTSAAVSNPNDFETLTLPDHTTVTVPLAEAKALKEFMQIYDLCTEYAYPNLAQPKWSDVVKFGNVVLDWYRQGIPFDAAEYERRVMAGESAVPQPQAATQPTVTQQPTVTVQETEYYLDTPIAGRIKVSESAYNKYKYASANWGTYLQYCKDNDVDISVKDLWDMLGENGAQTMVILQNMVESRKTPPQVVIPESVVPSVSVAPSEEKGNSLLVPGIILALGVIGAIALTSKSKKKRR